MQNPTQGSKSVEDYHKDMEMPMIRANVEEDKEAIMVIMLARLNHDIQDAVKLQHYVELEASTLSYESGKVVARKG